MITKKYIEGLKSLGELQIFDIKAVLNLRSNAFFIDYYSIRSILFLNYVMFELKTYIYY